MIYGIVHKGDHDVKVGTSSTTEWIREQIMLVRERDRVLCPRKTLKGRDKFRYHGSSRLFGLQWTRMSNPPPLLFSQSDTKNGPSQSHPW